MNHDLTAFPIALLQTDLVRLGFDAATVARH